MYLNKQCLLLDMNSTFMFGEDRFGDGEDFSRYYHDIGGTMEASEVNRIIRSAYHYLDQRYVDEAFRHCFPSLEAAIKAVTSTCLDREEMKKIIATFAFHECGYIPDDYIKAVLALREQFILAAVIDIWAPKTLWLSVFREAGIGDVFSAISFSSDHGVVKPSARPFQLVLDQLGLSASQALVIGDSARRDLGGAKAACIDCVLVGGAVHADALASYENLLAFCRALSLSMGHEA